jgi:hypothetical protein
MTTRRRQGAGSRQTAAYRALIGFARRLWRVPEPPVRRRPRCAASTLREEITHYGDLLARVIGTNVPAVIEWLSSQRSCRYA